ncbi:hypothetical protein CCR75_008051 [Bremia lactucae]|uniref:Uncharacterized protein n=1 Tax=Bremia lactucae TaxID=4779 RepID=A0A976FDY6_BRELC|nr:hypothetical protein CCR75_008051 [Bremia lactucae]
MAGMYTLDLDTRREIWDRLRVSGQEVEMPSLKRKRRNSCYGLCAGSTGVYEERGQLSNCVTSSRDTYI